MGAKRPLIGTTETDRHTHTHPHMLWKWCWLGPCSLHQLAPSIFIKRKKERKTYDTWHVTRDRWLVTLDMWYIVGSEHFLKYHLPSSYGFGLKESWRFGGKGWVNRLRPVKKSAHIWTLSKCSWRPPPLPPFSWTLQRHFLFKLKKNTKNGHNV